MCIFLCFYQMSEILEDACVASKSVSSIAERLRMYVTYALCLRIIDAVKIIRLSRWV